MGRRNSFTIHAAALPDMQGALVAAFASFFAANFSPDKWTAHGWQAIYAATLAANGRKADAIRIAKNINPKQLRPEEKKLHAPFWPPVDSRKKHV